MKFLILAFILVMTFSFCNNSGPTINSDSLVNESNITREKPALIDSGILVILFITRGGAPKGGKFSGHPAIHSNGAVDLSMIRNDPSRMKNDCEVKVKYTYTRGRDSFTIIKDVCFGGLGDDE